MIDRATLRKSKILKTLASLKITVTCLLLLFILTLWGTVAQVQNGLYLAQARYFESFFFFIFGFIPFPGAQMVMWVLFVNLISALLIRFVYKLERIGLLIIHGGLLLFLVSGYITLHCAKNSYISLKEGEAFNVSTAFSDWELSVWDKVGTGEDGRQIKNITGTDIVNFKSGRETAFADLGFSLTLQEYHRNCEAYKGAGDRAYVNASGIGKLEAQPLAKEPGDNIPGAVFDVKAASGESFPMILYGGEDSPTTIEVGDKHYNLILRKKRYVLPFTIKLVDFMMEKHPGTDTARSFKSRVAVETNGVWREKLISMNNPLRSNSYTFYQSSYAIDQFGRETSILAVVKNTGRLLPYIATFVTVLGLVVHFVMSALKSKKKKKS